MSTDGKMGPRSKLAEIRRMMHERTQLEKSDQNLMKAHRSNRRRIRELDAALSLAMSPRAEKYFRTIEGTHDETAIAGRIG